MKAEAIHPRSLIFDQYYKKLFSLALSIVHFRMDAHLVLEIVQSNFLSLSLEALQEIGDLDDYLEERVRMVGCGVLFPTMGE